MGSSKHQKGLCRSEAFVDLSAIFRMYLVNLGKHPLKIKIRHPAVGKWTLPTLFPSNLVFFLLNPQVVFAHELDSVFGNLRLYFGLF
jgi:hypothetical protein